MPLVKLGGNAGNDFAGVADATMSSAAPTSMFGTFSNMISDAIANRSCVIRCDALSNIPSDATINSAVWKFYQEEAYSSVKTITARRLLVPFVEAQVSFNDRATSTAWGTAGGVSDGVDRSATVSFTGTSTGVSGVGGFRDMSGAQLTADVAAIVSGAQSNYGWQFNSDGFFAVTATEGADGQRPELWVDYTPSGGGGVTRKSLFAARLFKSKLFF